jgi:hypothetical protein
MRLIRESEEFVGAGVLVVRLRGHRARDLLRGVRSPHARLRRVTFVLGHYLILIVEDSDF